ncbi:MAG TPA: lytic transglycosylase domain-containing protein [bacterium]|nr:lytic transglycosylase domain-containing protein [bacterium]
MRTLAMVLIAIVLVSTPSCIGSTIHGLDQAAWFELLASDAPLPITASDVIEYDALQQLGPGAILFIAMRAQDKGDQPLAIMMLREAIKRETGIYRERAVSLLADMLLADRDGAGLLELCRSDAATALLPYRRAYLEGTGLMITHEWVQALNALEALRSAFPKEAAQDAAELASLLFEAGFNAGQGNWVSEVASIVAMDGSPRVYAALSRVVILLASAPAGDVAPAITALGSRTMELVEARAFVGSKDFGPAVTAFRRYAAAVEDSATVAARIGQSLPGSSAGSSDADNSGPAFGDGSDRPLTAIAAGKMLLTLPRAIASDAAKAFIAISRDEGAAGFEYITRTLADRGADPSREYFNAYWHARFLRADDRWKDAEAWFARAASRAANSAERDAAQWYVVEAASKQSQALAIAALGKALSGCGNPGYFSDLLEPLSRDALIARNGGALVAIDAATSQSSRKDAARIAYLCARAAGLGIIKDADVVAVFGSRYADAASYAEARMQAAYDQRADDWYRIAAAYRLGKALIDSLAADPEADATQEPSGQKATASEQSAGTPAPDKDQVSIDEYALAMAKFGLGARVRSELGPVYASLAPATVRSIATMLSASGHHAQALRVIAWLYWRQSYTPTKADAELFWPRAYHQLFAEAAQSTGLDEFLLYGLARSESYFDPAAVSSSGALGLTQLLPATAAEIAGRLHMSEYSLVDPADNLRLGSAYFARILASLDGRVMPAVFSYNAGPTRFRRWEAEFGSLPHDMLLEALSYSETRQYGRNTVIAALTYAALYGDGYLRDYFAYLTGEGPRPTSVPVKP